MPPLALVGFTGLVFWGELTGGSWAYGRDTTAFYYPLTEWAARQLQQGRLPYWLPLIFGGYPLLADGEVGPLYPPNLLLLGTLPTPVAYAWLRAFHYAVAALGLYAFARALRVSPFGATIGGLAFGYGSFMIGHLQHDNIVRSAVWLPWLLLAAERALRASGFGRLAWTCAGGLVLALQGLGVHIQPLLLSLMLLAAYVLAGPLAGGAASRPIGADLQPTLFGVGRVGNPPLRVPLGPWLLVRVQVGLGIVGIGLGLAAAQLLPLYVLGLGSVRPALVTYAYATSYAVAPPQLLTLLFPYLFHFDVERSWALWSPYETTLYAGVAPLVLALVALGFVRGRAVAFFGTVALVSLVLCLGDYLPVKPYTLIWNLPGFAFLRAPARFSLLLELAIACLAALAADWLGRRAATRALAVAPPSRDGQTGPTAVEPTARSDGATTVAADGRSPAATRGLGRFLLALALGAIALGPLLLGLRWALQRYPSAALELFQATYLDTGRENWALGPWHVYYGLLEFSRPDNARTAFGLLLLALVPLLLRGWLRRPRLGGVWRAALALLVGLDLWLFVGGLHPRVPLEQLRPSTPAVDYLAAQPGPFRTFVEPSLNQALGPNQLVARELAIVNGYSSLEPGHLKEYWWSLVMQDNFLLDLFNVRYVLAPRRVVGQRTYRDTRYHPNDRLMSGAAGNPGGSAEFRVPPTRAEGLTVVAAVEGLPAGSEGAPVAEVTLRGAAGDQRIVTLRAEDDLGEYEADRAGRPTAEYTGPRVVWSGPSFAPSGTSRPVRLYGASVPLDPPLEVTGLAVRALAPGGRLHLHGLGLRTAEGTVHSLAPSDNAKYRLLAEDAGTLLLENEAAWPRAYAVGGAVAARTDVPIVEQLLGRSWDPSREILVEGAEPAEVRQATAGEPIGRAELLAYEPTRVVVRAELARPGYLVLADRHDDSWRAYADARELPILRANGIQRAVLLPAGTHDVIFAYDPWWVKLGFGLSGLTALLTLGALAVAAAARAWPGRR